MSRKQYEEFFRHLRAIVEDRRKESHENRKNITDRAEENGVSWHLGEFLSWWIDAGKMT